MQLVRIAALLMVLIAPAYSQDATSPLHRPPNLHQPPNQAVKALSDKLLEEMDIEIRLRMQLLEAQDKIRGLEAKVKELQPPEPDKKPSDAQSPSE